MLHSVIKLKKNQQNALNHDDPAEKFIAHEKRSLYMTGYIQGLEYVLNDFKVALDEEPILRQEIKDIEKAMKLGVRE